MPTFGQLKTLVSQKLLDPNNTAVSATDVGNAINDAIKFWKFRRLWFNVVSDTATLTEHDPVIPLPSNFLVEIVDNPFRIAYSTMRYDMQKRDPNVFDDWFLTNGYGIPQIYTNKAGIYYCYPIPDRDYTLLRYYLKDYDELTTDDQTNDFTDHADKLILYDALSRLYAENRQDDKMEAYYSARGEDEFTRLTTFTALKEAPEDLTLDSYLM